MWWKGDGASARAGLRREISAAYRIIIALSWKCRLGLYHLTADELCVFCVQVNGCVVICGCWFQVNGCVVSACWSWVWTVPNRWSWTSTGRSAMIPSAQAQQVSTWGKIRRGGGETTQERILVKCKPPAWEYMKSEQLHNFGLGLDITLICGLDLVSDL